LAVLRLEHRASHLLSLSRKVLYHLSHPSKNLKKDLPYNPTIPLLGIYSKEYKSIYKRDTA
jgi:hypothetical protein